MIAIDLGKQQALDSDPKVIQQINFIGHLAREWNANTAKQYFSLLKKQKKHFRFFTRNYGSIVHLFCFNIASV